MKKYLKDNRAYFTGVLVCILISSMFAVVLQFVKGTVLDNAILGVAKTTAASALLLVVLILLETLFYYLYNRFSVKFVVSCTKHLKHDIFESIMQRSYTGYIEHPQGEYIAKYTNEADAIKNRYFSMLPLFWEIFLKIVLVSIALFLLDWRIALITVLLLTTPLYIPKLIEKQLQKAQSEYIQSVEINLSRVSDWLSSFEIIKNFSIERKILERFRPVNDTAMEKYLRDSQLGVLSRLITMLISYLSYFTILAFAAWLVVIGDFTAGDFFVAIGMIDQLSYPLISLAGIIQQLLSVKPSCLSMQHFISIPAGKRDGIRIKNLNSEIRFRDVTFAYDEQAPVLQNFTLSISKGERCLIKGPSGCGKTTAVNLLLRYYDPATGVITIDDMPLTDFEDTYDLITVVRQDALLFNDTLRNNLTMYQEMVDDKLIVMLQRLGLSKHATETALNSIVTENGSNLSGGEKKRICLARALLRNTDVLILDEPLANLDSETAGMIEDLLLSIDGKTLLIVSHQFAEQKLTVFDQVIDFA